MSIIINASDFDLFLQVWPREQRERVLKHSEEPMWIAGQWPDKDAVRFEIRKLPAEVKSQVISNLNEVAHPPPPPPSSNNTKSKEDDCSSSSSGIHSISSDDHNHPQNLNNKTVIQINNAAQVPSKPRRKVRDDQMRLI